MELEPPRQDTKVKIPRVAKKTDARFRKVSVLFLVGCVHIPILPGITKASCAIVSQEDFFKLC